MSESSQKLAYSGFWVFFPGVYSTCGSPLNISLWRISDHTDHTDQGRPVRLNVCFNSLFKVQTEIWTEISIFSVWMFASALGTDRNTP